ncbi:MAG TPA: hypothetical protein VGH76_04690 [Actinomycetospora sp.]|uniref:hypothetical protein n=1 Tax=Actinomycetospora sp. TaxID=1872135 RepID=UPI002F40105C
MEIGPVRRRFTAEPVSSPVPARAPTEPSADAEPETPGREAVPTPDVPADLRS